MCTRRANHGMWLAGIAIAVIGCSNDASGPTPTVSTATIDIAFGDNQVGVAGGWLPMPLTAKVTDGSGKPMSGMTVTFAVASGGGKLNAATVVTDAQGLAATEWALGSGVTPGAQQATATLTGATGKEVTFTATATTRAFLAKLRGDGQTGEVTQALADQPTVVVRDTVGNPLAGVPVTWQVVSGGGSVSASQSISDSSGRASTSWTLGAKVGAGVHSLRAAVASSASTNFAASAVLTAGTLTIVAGDNQVAMEGLFVETPPTVLAKTPGPTGVAVEGVPVQWEVTAGGGYRQEARVLTGRDGTATNYWQLGFGVGSNNQGLRAFVAGDSGALVAFVASTVTRPRGPYTVSIVSGNLQAATAATTLIEPLVVLVQDSSGQPAVGVLVDWEAGGGFLWGEGSITPSNSLTDSDGRASAIATLPWWAGPSLTAGVAIARGEGCIESCLPGIAVFTATVLAAPPATVLVYGGFGQTAAAGRLLPLPIVVFVEDMFGNGIPGVTVNWAAADGSGSTTVASSVTNASGKASTGWTIGNTVGTNNQIATATVAGLLGSPVTFTASATAGP